MIMKQLLLLSLFLCGPLQARIWKWTYPIVRTFINDMSPVPSNDMTVQGVPDFAQTPFASGIVGAVSATPYYLRDRETPHTFFHVDNEHDALTLQRMNNNTVQWFYYRYGSDNPPYSTSPTPQQYPYPMIPGWDDASKTQEAGPLHEKENIENR